MRRYWTKSARMSHPCWMSGRISFATSSTPWNVRYSSPVSTKPWLTGSLLVQTTPCDRKSTLPRLWIPKSPMAKLMRTQYESDLGIMTGHAGRDREQEYDRREGVLEKVAQECSRDSYMKEILHPVEGQGVVLGNAGRFDLAAILGSSRVWFHLSLHPTDDNPATLGAHTNHWSAGTVSRQLRAWRLPEWANRRNKHLD